MTPFPLPLEALLAKSGTYLVFGLIGFGFGYVLEISGFGNSTKLADQFYFKDMTVLKVMFTAIVVAMVLIFGAIALGMLDYNLIWVNPTYLWPGIVGGLIMGVGFIVGGFCPGTSLVSMATIQDRRAVLRPGYACSGSSSLAKPCRCFEDLVERQLFRPGDPDGFFGPAGGRGRAAGGADGAVYVLGRREARSDLWQEGPIQGAALALCRGGDPGGWRGAGAAARPAGQPPTNGRASS